MGLLENFVDEAEKVLQALPAASPPIFTGATPPKGKQSGLILLKDTVAELGNPDSVSAGMLLYTNRPGTDGVHRVGADVSELQGKSVPFAMMAVLHGQDLSAETYYQAVTRFQRLADFPGWQVRLAKGRIWVRVASVDGRVPDLSYAAAVLTQRLKTDFPTVESIDVWFVTEHEDAVKQLCALVERAQASATGIKAQVWKERGFDWKSCQLSGHCGGCADKKACASVRTMEARIRVNRRKYGIEEGKNK